VPVRWHLIGHLQRNKARHVKRFHLVHSLDNPRLASILDDLGRQESHVVDALVQVNVVGEETKGGYDLASLPSEAERLRALANVRIRGVMTMAPLDADERTLRTVFSGARRARQLLREAGCADATELSMGMSNDYEIAVEEGATFVRLGTILFGARSA
jgi:pyridoxal phosphate enzyme (YggS family)